ncbi:MAG: PP2C family serine/threonine-protein phosphatase [Candidatus Berkiella sp.]
MKVNCFEATYLGARKSNQDYYSHVITEDWSCFVIADGLGGHFRGDIASKAYTTAFTQQIIDNASQVLTHPIEGFAQCMQKAWQNMCEAIHLEYGEIDTQTTFVAVWIDKNNLVCAHVGDSRAYLLNQQEILWRTADHTPVQALYEQGKITEEEFNYHPMQNRLLRTVNLYEPPDADMTLYPPIKSNETLLLCTDGFWNPLSRNDILLLGKTSDFKATSTQLVDAILADHPTDADNISLQLIRTI